MRPPPYYLLIWTTFIVPVLASSGRHFQRPLAASFELGESVIAERYDQEQVWRIHLQKSQKSMEEAISYVEDMNLDLWGTTKDFLDVRLNHEQKLLLQTSMGDGAVFESFISNLQSLIKLTTPIDYADPSHFKEDEEEEDSSLSRKRKEHGEDKRPKVDPFNLTTLDTPFHDNYHTFEDLYKFGSTIVETFNDQQGLKVWEFDVGKTWEGRAIKGWSAKLESNEAQSDVRGNRIKREDESEELGKEIVIMSGQHGREWVGPSSALYFLHSLLLSSISSTPSDTRLLLRHFTFTVIPTINPDGFVYSRSHRMWRKNRQPVGHRSCVGIDLNANWGYDWTGQNEPSPCKDNYPGNEAFEAWETKAVGEWLARGEERGLKVIGFVDLHSYGQLFMFPFAHSCKDFPEDAEMLMEAGLGVVKAIRMTHGETYETGQACDLTFRSPGDSVDYSYGVTDVRWSYSAELRDTGTYGFMLPRNFIRPTAEEITAGLLYLAKFIYIAEAGP
ncbi:uncharacterized protein L203_102042 [Cryptococcus depauperatus CBS 7841]|uniref:Inactive metallocarboxypeptidase ECM14 n=1 Tax=Cryptococcus depauperatus CBS 7841 TaxID=1295531 RepID=A0A1E3ITR2_9TREE|nr:carboxypeptidase A4 [Cryptococcus depauperatus CBS 7841]